MLQEIRVMLVCRASSPIQGGVCGKFGTHSQVLEIEPAAFVRATLADARSGPALN
jgi:hypothetical protein